MSTVHKLPTITVTASDDLPEVLQINDVLLKVLPSDIVSFQNNAVFEESYLRSKAVFAFRSKQSRGKIIVTYPISMHPLAHQDDKEVFKIKTKKGYTLKGTDNHKIKIAKK
jgi:hypothetical protein